MQPELEKGTIEYYDQVLVNVMNEARQYDIHIVAIMHSLDPLSCVSTIAGRRNCDKILAIGMTSRHLNTLNTDDES